MDTMERRIQKLVGLFAICFLVSCATVEDTGPTEMQGEPVNIALKGQKEMCEREPESILCKEEEVDE
jgi:hypothetical protein